MPHTKLEFPILALVTDRMISGDIETLLEDVEAALDGGVNMVQLREKDLSQNDQLALAPRLRELTEGRALLFVNGDLTVALLSSADGAQLGEEHADLTRQAAAQGLVGRSVHDVNGATRAKRAGAHLLFVGPVYETRTHPGMAPAGLSLIREITAAVDLPVVGIGGITPETAGDVIAAGASGVAVIRGILAMTEPSQAARRLREAVDAAWARVGEEAVGEAGE